MMRANFQVADYDVVDAPQRDDVAVFAAPLSVVLTQELDGASAALGLSAEDLIVAALGRAIARTIGPGVVAVDRPGLSLSAHPMAIPCLGPDQLSATEMLAQVHQALATSSRERIMHDVSEDAAAQPLSEILFTYGAGDPTQLRHALRLSAYRDGDVLALDWSYDTRSFEPYTVQELAEQFPYALIELTSEAMGPVLVTEMAFAH
ncbi:hypothetical protein [Mycolicibacterium hodleri]|uniref:Polyketide synthase n=1 Tax=Mycolicibacterium hodleri TaxID=49897 RepID=A0A502E763_9MYCO|nr:hypothetical protein [Mycolicibacterium hodleri]TPG32260.1 hypothetical protein EAH80_20850 [Mycolicibacterium hodleri]